MSRGVARDAHSRTMDTTIPGTGGTTDADGPAAASALVAACEQAWQAIQDRHPEVPHAVIVLGTGVERGRLVKLGHWWAGRWIADGEPRGEVLLAGEALHLPATDVFEVLLHEAAHGLNAARHIKDTSRGGRYHNRRFQQTAESVGLTVAKLGPYGWAQTSLTADTTVAYGDQIQGVATAMRIARTLTRPPATINGPENDDGRQGPSSGDTRSSTGPARCGCGRRMRMAPSVLAQGPVICGLCHEPFTTEPRAATRALAVDHHQPDRTEPPAGGSEHAWQADARQTIATALNDEIGRRQFEQVAAWYGQRRAGHDPTLTALEGRDRETLERLARALLMLDGTLRSPTITIRGREFAVGESIRFAEFDSADRDGHALLMAGMFGTVTEIDPAGHLSVDVPIAGRYRLDADARIAGALRHAYTDPPSRIAAPRLAEHRGDEVDVGCEL